MTGAVVHGDMEYREYYAYRLPCPCAYWIFYSRGAALETVIRTKVRARAYAVTLFFITVHCGDRSVAWIKNLVLAYALAIIEYASN